MRDHINILLSTALMSSESSLAPLDSTNRDWKRRQHDMTRLLSKVGISSLVFLRTNRMLFAMVSSQMVINWSFNSWDMPAGVYLHIHVSTGSLNPIASGGSHTTPSRLTVAGEAWEQSSTSKSMRIVLPLSLMRSPFGRHKVRLSSSTVFMFSIQMASIGPSKTTNFLSSVVSELALRMMVEPRPSVHSFVMRL